MAQWTIRNVKITGISATFPKNTIRTEEFDFFSREEAEIFNKTVGIKERRIATDKLCASDLCADAAERLLKDLQWDKESIDILIFESITPDYKTPPTSCILQHRLGLCEHCFTLDMPMGCCGFLYALNIGGNLLQNGNAKRALLLIGDTTSKTGSPKDKSRAPLFGDAGTAVALEYDESASEIIIEFHTEGKDYEVLMTPHGGTRNPVTPDSFNYVDFGNGIVRAPIHALINGMNVYSFAISRPPRSIVEFMERNNIRQESVDFFLIHQANKMILDRMIKKLKIPQFKVPMNLDEFGNLGGASIPALMVTRMSKELNEKSNLLILSSFGLGLTWSTAALNIQPLIISKPHFI